MRFIFQIISKKSRNQSKKSWISENRGVNSMRIEWMERRIFAILVAYLRSYRPAIH